MVKRFLTSFLRANVRDGADAKQTEQRSFHLGTVVYKHCYWQSKSAEFFTQHVFVFLCNNSKIRFPFARRCTWVLSPALFMVGRAPLRAHRRLPPNGTYCWLGGRDSVLSSWRRCFSLRMEWTAFRKSFLLSGELQIGQKHKKSKVIYKRRVFVQYHIQLSIYQKGSAENRHNPVYSCFAQRPHLFKIRLYLQLTCFEYMCTVFEK